MHDGLELLYKQESRCFEDHIKHYRAVGTYATTPYDPVKKANQRRASRTKRFDRLVNQVLVERARGFVCSNVFSDDTVMFKRVAVAVSVDELGITKHLQWYNSQT